eukprot:CAMPEP_0175563826 /NCGR_PEP_ID=MMETSP0096-20121207/38620_1 /TAXON_ID=311494 /ORGANISM="Alexandrium monilatum, Strain CCMP3105" /LENGTH=130 /DNA_ID=CAMNT_0016867077 /DNA_START=1 /DNA_END=390 /DNA_ORIENTATION=+
MGAEAGCSASAVALEDGEPGRWSGGSSLRSDADRRVAVDRGPGAAPSHAATAGGARLAGLEEGRAVPSGSGGSNFNEGRDPLAKPSSCAVCLKVDLARGSGSSGEGRAAASGGGGCGSLVHGGGGRVAGG